MEKTMDAEKLEEAARWQKHAETVARYERKYPMIWYGLSAPVYKRVRVLMGIEGE